MGNENLHTVTITDQHGGVVYSYTAVLVQAGDSAPHSVDELNAAITAWFDKVGVETNPE